MILVNARKVCPRSILGLTYINVTGAITLLTARLCRVSQSNGTQVLNVSRNLARLQAAHGLYRRMSNRRTSSRGTIGCMSRAQLTAWRIIKYVHVNARKELRVSLFGPRRQS